MHNKVPIDGGSAKKKWYNWPADQRHIYHWDYRLRLPEDREKSTVLYRCHWCQGPWIDQWPDDKDKTGVIGSVPGCKEEECSLMNELLGGR